MRPSGCSESSIMHSPIAARGLIHSSLLALARSRARRRYRSESGISLRASLPPCPSPRSPGAAHQPSTGIGATRRHRKGVGAGARPADRSLSARKGGREGHLCAPLALPVVPARPSAPACRELKPEHRRYSADRARSWSLAMHTWIIALALTVAPLGLATGA